MSDYTDEPMNLTKNRIKTPDDSAIIEEEISDKELEKIALAAGGPDLDGKYKEKK